MDNQKYFSISGVSCVAHTPETRAKWASLEGNKSELGRQAIIAYAKERGFEYSKESELDIVLQALNYLLGDFRGMFGAKSHVIRKAIIHYCS